MGHCLEVLKREHGILPAGIIHVGANTGQEIPIYRRSGIRPVVLIEPQAVQFDQLSRAAGETPGFYPLRTCLSDVADKSIEFHVASNGGKSSSYLRPAVHMDIYPDVTFNRTETMVTDTLDRAISRLCREHDLRPESFEYICLDTQGSEMDILRGGTETLAHARYVFTEVNFGNLYAGDTGLYKTIDLMRGWDFDLYHLSMKAGGWGDALFMRGRALDSASAAEAKARRLRRRRAARNLAGA